MFGRLRVSTVALIEILIIFIDTPFRWVFGRDIFISYSRADATQYAQKLYNRLSKDHSCYLDQRAFPRGKKLPRSIRRSLRRSSMLVLIGTKGAIASDYVRLEFRKFLRTRRVIVPVNINNELDGAPWNDKPWKDIYKVFQPLESKEAFDAHLPSDDVIGYITESADFTRQDQRLRLIARATAAFVLVAFLAAGLSLMNAFTANRRAENANFAAQNSMAQADEAGRRAENFNQNANAAQKLEARANQVAANANARAIEADAKALNANTRATLATRRQEAANKNASKQESIAFSRSLAAQSDLIYNPDPDQLEHNLLYSVESMRRDYSTVAYRNLLNGMKLIPNGPNKVIPFDDYLRGATYSADGRFLAAKTENNVVIYKTWDHEPVMPALKHLEVIRTMRFSPTGRYLATISGGTETTPSALRVWDLEARRELPQLEGNSIINHIVFSRDGEYLAVDGGSTRAAEEKGNSDGNIARVWQLGTELREVGRMLHDARVTGVALSPDSKYLATYSHDRVRVWQATGGRQELGSAGDGDEVGNLKQLFFTANGRYLMGIHDSSSGALNFTEVVVLKEGGGNPFANGPSWSSQFVKQFPVTNVSQLVDADDGKYIAAITSSGTIDIIDTEGPDFEQVISIPYDTRGVGFVNAQFSKDGRFLAFATPYQWPRIYESSTGKLVAYIPLTDAKHYDGNMAFSPGGLSLAVGLNAVGVDEKRVELREWDLGRTDLAFTPLEAKGSFTNIATNSNGTIWAAVSLESVSVHRPDEKPLELPFKNVHEIALSLNGERLALTSGKSVLVCETTNGVCRPTTYKPTEEVEGLAFSWDAKRVAISSGLRVTIEDVAKGQSTCLKTLTEPRHVALSQDGNYLAMSYLLSGSVDIWDLRNSKKIAGVYHADVKGGDVSAVAFGPTKNESTGRFYMFTASQESARVWDVTEMQTKKPAEVARLPITGANGSVKLSVDGRYLLAINWLDDAFRGQAPKFKLWRWQPEDVLSQICGRLTRSILDWEWHSDFPKQDLPRPCRNFAQ